MTVFGDVNVSVYGNSDVLKFTFTFKCVLLENQKCNYFNHLLYIAVLYGMSGVAILYVEIYVLYIEIFMG